MGTAADLQVQQWEEKVNDHRDKGRIPGAESHISLVVNTTDHASSAPAAASYAG